MYAMLIYLTLYLCKSEHIMSELMKKAAEESTCSKVIQELHATCNMFLSKREVSPHKPPKRET